MPFLSWMVRFFFASAVSSNISTQTSLNPAAPSGQRLVFSVNVGPVVGHCDVAVVIVAFAHATVIAVIQAKDVPNLLALNTADVTVCAGTAGSPIVGVVPGMGVFDTTPPPMMPPVIRGILDAGQPPP